MDPQAPNPSNRYDYILNAPPARNKPFGGKNTKLVSVLFILFVVLLVIIAVSVFRSLTKKDYSTYVKLAQKQTEILRVADLGLKNARSSDAKNYVTTVQVVTASEQSNTLAFLKKKGINVSPSKLKLLKDTSTDTTLTAASQTSTYDDTLLSVLRSLENDYYTSVRQATASPIGTSEATLAAQLNANAAVLVTK